MTRGLAVGIRLAITVAALIAASACGRGGGGPSVDGDELRIVGPWEITSLDPLRTGYVFTRMQIVEMLVGADDAGQPMPGLATRWEISPDQLEWRFILRPNARFHDGSPVTAHAVVESLRRAQIEPGALALAPVREIVAGDGSVTVRLSSPFAPLPALLAHSSAQVLGPASFDATEAVRTIIGSGPYRITSLEMPQRFSVEAFGSDTPDRTSITRASYLSVGRSETRALLAESGQADVVFGLDAASVARLRSRSNVRVEAVTIPRTIELLLNAGHPWLSDLRVRQAISLAIARGDIARALLRDPEMAATQLFPPTLAEWHTPGLPPLRTDVAEAQRLLQGLGWTLGSDGILERAGVRFKLTLRTYPDRPELPVMAAAIQDQLRQIGIDVSVSIGNSSEVPAAHHDDTLELGLTARNFANVPDPIGTLLQDFAGEGGDWGAMHWSSAPLTSALDELTRTLDAGRRAELRSRIAQILHAELPVIPVGWYRQTAAVNHRVSGVSLDPLEQSYRITGMRWSR